MKRTKKKSRIYIMIYVFIILSDFDTVFHNIRRLSVTHRWPQRIPFPAQGHVRKRAAGNAAGERQLRCRAAGRPGTDGRASADQSPAVPVPRQQQGRGRPGRHGRQPDHARPERDHQPTVALAGGHRPPRRRLQTAVGPGQRPRQFETIFRRSVRLYR